MTQLISEIDQLWQVIIETVSSQIVHAISEQLIKRQVIVVPATHHQSHPTPHRDSKVRPGKFVGGTSSRRTYTSHPSPRRVWGPGGGTLHQSPHKLTPSWGRPGGDRAPTRGPAALEGRLDRCWYPFPDLGVTRTSFDGGGVLSTTAANFPHILRASPHSVDFVPSHQHIPIHISHP
jgi:hypothetical protein